MTRESPRSGFQTAALVTLRMLVGWHFLYEGLAKLVTPYWTSAEYMDQARWLFRGMFQSMAASPTAVTVLDFANAWGLTLIGAGLLVGLLTRTATAFGLAVLVLYYVVAPPFVGFLYAMPAEGSYLVVNKVLVEAAALLVLLAFPTGHQYGLDALVSRRRGAAYQAPERAGA
jgi:thiosulfate dehydrogenase [quinone] large subunit